MSLKIAICSVIRNAAQQLDVWFRYHQALGVTDFYIIHNPPSLDTTGDIIDQYATYKETRTGDFIKRAWLTELLNKAVGEDGCDICFLIDADEFLNCPTSIVDSLKLYIHTGNNIAYRMPGYVVVPESPSCAWWQASLCDPSNMHWSKSCFVYGEKTQAITFNSNTSPRLLHADQTGVFYEPSDEQNIEFPLIDSSSAAISFCHVNLLGMPALRQKIYDFLETPDKAIEVMVRYGDGILNPTAISSRTFSEADKIYFASEVADDDVMNALYNDLVYSSIVRSTGLIETVRNGVSALLLAPDVHNAIFEDAKSEALTSWGINPSSVPTPRAQITSALRFNLDTNLSLGSSSTTTREIKSSTGTSVFLPAATTTIAGLFSASDKTHLNGLVSASPETLSLSSTGSGTSLLNSTTNPNLSTKSLSVGTGLDISSTSTDITLTNSSPASDIALTNSGTGGETLLNSSTNPSFSTKALTMGTGMSSSSTATDITLTNSSPASSIALTNSSVGGTSLLNAATNPAFSTKGLQVAGTALAISNNTTDITLTSTALPTTGGTMSGEIAMGNQDITGASLIDAKKHYVRNGATTGHMITSCAGSANIPFVLPVAQGSASTFLQNDGFGALTWASVAGGGAPLKGVRFFSGVAANLIYTPTVGTTRALVYAQGGGGAGAGAVGSSNNGYGGGGNAGGTAVGYFVIDDTKTGFYTNGAGGAANTAGAGNVGSSTSFLFPSSGTPNGTITGLGGAGGLTKGGTNDDRFAMASSSVSTGTISTLSAVLLSGYVLGGARGGYGFSTAGDTMISGVGANSMFGVGGAEVYVNNANQSTAGNAGSGSGSGGSGGVHSNGTNSAGGAGARGCVLILEY